MFPSFHFRVWDEQIKKMYPVEYLRFLGKSRQREENSLLVEVGSNDEWDPTQQFKLLLSTSLSDVTEEEIFQGDLVVIRPGIVDPFDEDIPRYVHWSGGQFWLMSMGHDQSLDFLRFHDNLKIIGNIYENRDLARRLLKQNLSADLDHLSSIVPDFLKDIPNLM